MKIGDMIRYTRTSMGEKYLTPEVWVQVTSADPWLGKIILGKFSASNGRTVTISPPYRTWTGRKIIPEEEWPDEVCAEMAKRALIGEMCDS